MPMNDTYVTALADSAINEKRPDVRKEIDTIVLLLAAEPISAGPLAEKLETRPDLQAKISALTGYTPSLWLLEHELEDVKMRRANLGLPPVAVDPEKALYKRAAEMGLMGLCFSGGGIRSATFNLGVLQGLAQLDLLRCFDYLSSVSGGGYIHQWFAAWIKRTDVGRVNRGLVPLPEKDNPGTHPEPIRWLRRYSNYLTPEKGLLTADTWVAIATWVRNTVLNQIILISGLLFLMLLPHLLAFRFPGNNSVKASVITGAILFLNLFATVLVARNLTLFGATASQQQPNLVFGQGRVQLFLVGPLLTGAFLLTVFVSLARLESNSIFLLSGAWLLLFALALAITLAGGAPLSYLKSHPETSKYDSFRQFWKNEPTLAVRAKAVLSMAGLLLISLFASLCGAVWILIADLGVPLFLPLQLSHPWRLTLVFGPPLVLVAPLLTMLVLLGLLGRTFQEARREWLSRLAAWIGLYSLLWSVFLGFSLFGSFAVASLLSILHLKGGITALAGWALTWGGGVLAGKSDKSSGAKSDKAPSTSVGRELLAAVAPYVFVAGTLLLLSWLAENLFTAVSSSGSVVLILLLFAVPLLVCLFFAWRVDINEFSMQAFYRNRLARCYLGASNTTVRNPNPFTGFDENDAEISVSELCASKGYYGPYPIFCTTLNVTFGEDLAWQERKAASFVFAPLHSGYHVGWTAAKGPRSDLRFNGYVRTADYAYKNPGIHIATAVATSGAAVSPNQGYHTNPATAFLLTLFNVRLGWWLRNPRVLQEDGTRVRDKLTSVLDPHPWPSPHFSLLSLLKELLGWTNDTNQYVYLTDGAHFDNTGLYELVRRRCRYIVVCDAEEDPGLRFEGIGMAIRKCRVDFGVEIDLDLRPLQHVGDTQNSGTHCVVGSVTYPEDPATSGTIVYMKSTLTGDEPADILNYKQEHVAFPHDSTANQWFTESQFESYRRLGHHIALSTLKPGEPGALNCSALKKRSEYFHRLKAIWCPPTPEMQKYSASHTLRYASLLHEIRTDTHLPGLFQLLFTPDGGSWKTNRTASEIEYAVNFSSEIIEFMFVVYKDLDLVLPEHRQHPFAEGWYSIFQTWGKVDVIQEAWKRYALTYSMGFRIFVQDQLKLP